MYASVCTVMEYPVTGDTGTVDAQLTTKQRGVSVCVYYGYIRGIYPEYGSQVCIYSIFNNKQYSNIHK